MAAAEAAEGEAAGRREEVEAGVEAVGPEVDAAATIEKSYLYVLYRVIKLNLCCS